MECSRRNRRRGGGGQGTFGFPAAEAQSLGIVRLFQEQAVTRTGNGCLTASVIIDTGIEIARHLLGGPIVSKLLEGLSGQRHPAPSLILENEVSCVGRDDAILPRQVRHLLAQFLVLAVKPN